MLLKYFFEIKNRIILIIISWCLTLIVSYLNKEILLFLCIKPMLVLSDNNSSFYFIATNLTDVFSTYLELVYLTAFSLTVIFSGYHFSIFLNPALYLTEVNTLKIFGILSIVLWLISLQFLHKIVLPFTLFFFASFQDFSINNVNIFLEARINDYVFIYIFFYWVLVIFLQIFLLFSLVLSTLKKKLEFIKNTRKIFYLIFFLISTILTPPDIISQIFLGFSFILIYETLIIIIILKTKCNNKISSQVAS